MKLLIYYNPNYNNFYVVYTNYLPFDKKVGFENGYGHILVQILVPKGNNYVSINSYSDLIKENHYKKESLKSRLARRMIRWLNKYRE